jgi:hypothetical protein
VSIANGLSVNEVNGPSVSKTNGLKIKDMTVKEIFELRKEGRVEEAYNAILPMYRVHHGKYTSLAMFWCAVDMMNLLLGKAVDQSEESLSALAEAEKIYLSLQRLAPKLYDESGACAKAVENLGVALSAVKGR